MTVWTRKLLGRGADKPRLCSVSASASRASALVSSPASTAFCAISFQGGLVGNELLADVRFGSNPGHSAMSTQCLVCWKAEMAGRFGMRPSSRSRDRNSIHRTARRDIFEPHGYAATREAAMAAFAKSWRRVLIDAQIAAPLFMGH
jgi:hypothetical protein